MMPLTMAETGRELEIRRIGGKEETRRFLESLGFVMGGFVNVVSMTGGDLIVKVKDSRVAISREMANRIMVQEDGCGDTVKVVKIHGEGAVRRRIMDMGITKNVELYIRKVAPLGDPVEVTVRGYELSLRKADAEMIEVQA